MSDLSHLAEDYRERAMWADKERIAWIRMDRWLGFPKAETVRKTLDAMLRYPPRTRMPCLLIYGQTGMGKSRIVERFEAENPRGFNDTTGTATIPVVAVQLPPQPTDGEFYGEVLEKLGAGFAGRGDVQRARQLTRRIMGQVGARMLILDEINHMLACTPRQQRVFLNTLRYLANDLQIPLVCTGNHEARAALLTDAALAERFDAVELVRWQNDEPFRLLMVTLAAILPLRKPSQLEEERCRTAILDLSDGNTGRIFRLVETLAVRAIENGTERIEVSDLDADDLVLPSVSMKALAQRRGRGRATAAA
ncbi:MULTISPECIES: TniB family NTP-binding protein [Sphingomonas]|jgi:hypothetical protein|uniref:AAA+ ATPase domain-containing protein n=1 Tax=Sphingomonas aquatilis TaxID=93063 RepID=A0AAW3TXP9_9SPHN|nr:MULTISPECIES: TniB family NTP-binding protein [Sphingomonas]MBB3877361.1 hypothetical protein [Sphingomonas aquatilis]MDK8187551.1 TniB family NTP-binding protein [Sphingomonas zeae]MDK8217289.1 TniB family NTP-binding protein [Sphingomonas sp. UMB7805-LC452B]MDR6789278.1 hypothetical protein [Sphingomonas sp. BE138]GEM71812.1 transposition protein TniB [Sphingomonas aquatilis NBRC 16722]